MMVIFAMPPPVPLEHKIGFSLLMLVLAGWLIRTRLGRPLTTRSMIVSVIATVTSVILLNVITIPYSDLLADRGKLGAALGALIAAVCLRPNRSMPSPAIERGRAMKLSVVALICGPLAGLLLAALFDVLVGQSPLDRGNTFRVLTLVGGFCGLIAAGVISISAGLTRLIESRH